METTLRDERLRLEVPNGRRHLRTCRPSTSVPQVKEMWPERLCTCLLDLPCSPVGLGPSQEVAPKVMTCGRHESCSDGFPTLFACCSAEKRNSIKGREREA
jgi:hypothetical protein